MGIDDDGAPTYPTPKTATAGECEGACERHGGPVSHVHVAQWGDFYYCDAAIAEDRRRGLTVTPAPNAKEPSDG